MALTLGNGTITFGDNSVQTTSAFVAGTVVLFGQAAAPTGWTQNITDNADNRMLRVVKTAGAGIGGSHSPILNNVVASHTHGFSTGNANSDHSHSYVMPSGQALLVAGGGGTWMPSQAGASTGGQSAQHSHSGSTDNGSSGTNWTPRYIDLILCAKD
jgi:hypothetical protein